MGILKGITKLFLPSDEKTVKKLQPIVDQINAVEDSIEALTDFELRACADDLRGRARSGTPLDDLLVEAFALVREASKRTLGQRHYDVQIIGGVVLHEGKIAEMQTGEGKTLVATLAAFLNSLNGKGVHVVTVNDYLARRDAEWMAAIYSLLGTSVAALQHDNGFVIEPSNTESMRIPPDLKIVSRQDVYAADITYGTNNEFGFDYLRDNMVESIDRRVQRKLNYAIVDEVDNILVDEARTPLIISGPSQQNPNEYSKFARISPTLNSGSDYTIDEKHKSVSLSQDGISKIEAFLKIDNLYAPENLEQVHYVENALRAEVIYQRDREYVVRNGEVIIVDEFTGRLMDGRRYSDGLHQAIEAKEKVPVQRESVTYATITLQNFFRLYQRLSGMTGTAATEAEEFWKIYNLEVVSIPTNKPTMRLDHPDLIYRDQAAKYRAVVDEIEQRINLKQPVLVGTTDIDKSEIISQSLKRRGIKHEVLNAKHHEREATIIAQAGRPGAVTVATNMAGRGTDIVLGGSPDLDEMPNNQWQKDHQLVLDAGGLCIIGTERHEARRIDNQLRGRSGRQGDPGITRFFVALDDDVVRRFGGERIQSIMDWAGMEADTPIENKMISKSIENAQVKVEAHHFDMRKHLVEYDDVINAHRDVIYKQRNRAIEGLNLRPQIQDMFDSECNTIVFGSVDTSARENWAIEPMLDELSTIIPLSGRSIDTDHVLTLNENTYLEEIFEEINRIYDEFEENFGSDTVRQIERFLLTKSIDTNWVQHLTTMENLRQGIGLQAFGQRDPLVMYKRQGHEMFRNLQDKIQSDIVRTMFRPGRDVNGSQSNVSTQANHVKTESHRTAAPVALPTQKRSGESPLKSAKIGRNERCPCGSGKKFKKCCGQAA